MVLKRASGGHSDAQKGTPGLTRDQADVAEDWKLMLDAMSQARSLTDWHTVERMHYFLQGNGITTDPVKDQESIRKDIGFHGPQYAFKLGRGMKLEEVDFAYKRKLQVVTIWPPKDAHLQYNVTSVEDVRGEKNTWKVTAARARGEEPKEWTMRREGNILKVTGKESARDMWVEEDASGGFVVHRINDALKTLELHSYAKSLGIKTEATELERKIWDWQLGEYRRGGDWYNVAKMRYHMQNLGIRTEPKQDEKNIRLVLARYSKKRDGNGEAAAGLLLFMPAIGIRLTDEEKRAAEYVVRKALKDNRKVDDEEPGNRDGESAAWLHLALHRTYGDELFIDRLQKIPGNLLQQAVGEPFPPLM